MNNIKNTLLLSLLIVFSTFGCKDDSNDDGNTTASESRFEMYFSYFNPDGDNPTIMLNSEFDSSTEIIIDSSSVVTETLSGNQVQATFNNVAILRPANGGQAQVNYIIEDVSVEVYEDGEWYLDTEFEYSFSELSDLEMVMVLDASTSLGTQFPQIQSFVKKFVDNVYRDVNNVSVGIVDFAGYIDHQIIQGDQLIVNQYIDNIELRGDTKLYEGMDRGLDLFNLGDATPNNQPKTKAMVTFTDGRDNYSDTESYNEGTLLNRLISDENGNSRVASFTIGMGDNINETVLRNLAVNGGIASFPSDLEALEGVFDDFASTVSTSNSLTYQRNDQKISAENAKSLRFVIKVKEK